MWDVLIFSIMDEIMRINVFLGIIFNSVLFWIINMPIANLFNPSYNFKYGQ